MTSSRISLASYEKALLGIHVILQLAPKFSSRHAIARICRRAWSGFPRGNFNVAIISKHSAPTGSIRVPVLHCSASVHALRRVCSIHEEYTALGGIMCCQRIGARLWDHRIYEDQGVDRAAQLGHLPHEGQTCHTWASRDTCSLYPRALGQVAAGTTAHSGPAPRRAYLNRRQSRLGCTLVVFDFSFVAVW